jgi:16S rRNA (uracil1498-N3)-methyltransferase
MKNFILQTPPAEGGIIRLYEKDYHYLVRVRRLGSGMDFNAILPGGTETKVRILSIKDNILIGQCLEEEKLSPTASLLPPIALFQGLPNGAKMDLIVRQAAEAGVSVITPFRGEYSQAAGSKDHSEKIKRWERIIKEARQQSGSITETIVMPPCGFHDLLEYWGSLREKYSHPIGLVLHQEPP